jgi:hypothetical protein
MNFSFGCKSCAGLLIGVSLVYLERAIREFADADYTAGCYDMVQMANLVAIAAKVSGAADLEEAS